MRKRFLSLGEFSVGSTFLLSVVRAAGRGSQDGWAQYAHDQNARPFTLSAESSHHYAPEELLRHLASHNAIPTDHTPSWMNHQGGFWQDGAYNTGPHRTDYAHQYDYSTLPHGEATYLHQQFQKQQPWDSNNFAFANVAYIAPEESQGLYMDGMVDSSSSQPTRLGDAEAEEVGDMEAESAQEAGGGRGEAEQVWTSNLEPLSQKDALKMRVGTLWKRKGLWVGMPAKEIAAGFAEIKIEVGGHLNSQSGHVLANYLKLHPQSSARYMKEVKGWSRKFISRLQKLNERYDREMGRRRKKGKEGRGRREDGGTRESTEEQEKRKAYLFKYIPFVQTRDQYTRLVGNEEEADKQDEGKRLHRDSRNAWAALGEHFRGGRLDATTSMKEIEIESRYLTLFLSTYTMEEVANLLKFYMIETFHRTPEEIDVFNKERNQWLEQCERDKAAQGLAAHGSTSQQMQESWEDLL